MNIMEKTFPKVNLCIASGLGVTFEKKITTFEITVSLGKDLINWIGHNS